MPYYVYIEGEFTQGHEGCFATYWYQEDSLTKAICYSIEDAKSRLGIAFPRVESVLFDESEEPPEETVFTKKDKLFNFEEIHTWELTSEDHNFVFPSGIVPANMEGPFELDEINEGYFWENNDKLFSITIVIDGRQFHGRFLYDGPVSSPNP